MTIEEQVNQLEAFVAQDCHKLYFGVYTRLRELFLQRKNIETYNQENALFSVITDHVPKVLSEFAE
jgi:hypothetical protein